MVPVANFLVGYTLGVDLTSSSFPKYLFGLREGAKQGGAKLTFLIMDRFVWVKGERYSLRVGLTSPPSKKLFELRKGQKEEGQS